MSKYRKIALFTTLTANNLTNGIVFSVQKSTRKKLFTFLYIFLLNNIIKQELKNINICTVVDIWSECKDFSEFIQFYKLSYVYKIHTYEYELNSFKIIATIR